MYKCRYKMHILSTFLERFNLGSAQEFEFQTRICLPLWEPSEPLSLTLVPLSQLQALGLVEQRHCTRIDKNCPCPDSQDLRETPFQLLTSSEALRFVTLSLMLWNYTLLNVDWTSWQDALHPIRVKGHIPLYKFSLAFTKSKMLP